MALNLFGLVPGDVKDNHFPTWSALSGSSKPTFAVVEQQLNEAAAEVAAALNKEAIDASAIVEDSTAWLKCRKAVRIECALQLMWAASGIDPELAKAWKAWLADFYEKLDEGGSTSLGDGATTMSPSDPNGPTSHISAFGLKTDDAVDMSTTVPLLRKDDPI